jgi:hypothetical protein
MTTPLDNYLAIVPADKTSLTDDERIDNIVPLPPPEHLIRFFPIQGTQVETLVTETRRKLRQILHGPADRLLVVMGPCSSTIRRPPSRTRKDWPRKGRSTEASSSS